jgi:hypothetical protein
LQGGWGVAGVCKREVVISWDDAQNYETRFWGRRKQALSLGIHAQTEGPYEIYS